MSTPFAASSVASVLLHTTGLAGAALFALSASLTWKLSQDYGSTQILSLPSLQAWTPVQTSGAIDQDLGQTLDRAIFQVDELKTSKGAPTRVTKNSKRRMAAHAHHSATSRTLPTVAVSARPVAKAAPAEVVAPTANEVHDIYLSIRSRYLAAVTIQADQGWPLWADTEIEWSTEELGPEVWVKIGKPKSMGARRVANGSKAESKAKPAKRPLIGNRQSGRKKPKFEPPKTLVVAASAAAVAHLEEDAETLAEVATPTRIVPEAVLDEAESVVLSQAEISKPIKIELKRTAKVVGSKTLDAKTEQWAPQVSQWEKIPPSDELVALTEEKMDTHDYSLVVSQSAPQRPGMTILNTQGTEASNTIQISVPGQRLTKFVETVKPAKPSAVAQKKKDAFKPKTKPGVVASLADQYQDAKFQPVQPPSVAIEWLNSKQAVRNVEEATLTLGGDIEEALGGWDVLAAQDYTTTMSFRKSRDTLAVPMLAKNTRRYLETLRSGLKQGEETGILFGDLPGGWDILTSGQSEDPLLLDSEGRVSKNRASAVHFVLFNAEPGAHKVTLRRLTDGRSSAAIVAPVSPGRATYLDLTDLREITIEGRVLDASHPELAGVVGSTVTVLGHPTSVVAGDKGWFVASQVFSVYPYPVVLETAVGAQWPHRYEVAQDRLTGVELFRLGTDQIEVFGEQIGANLQREQESMIVGAFPQYAGMIEKGKALYPVVSAFENIDEDILAETYAVAPSGQLLVHSPLDRNLPRLASMRVPQGLSIAQLETTHGDLVWSRLLLHEPGVITIIGTH